MSDFRDKRDLTAELGVDDANGGDVAYFMTFLFGLYNYLSFVLFLIY